MSELKKKTIAALEKQVELLTLDGVVPAKQDAAVRAILVLSDLLAVLNHD